MDCILRTTLRLVLRIGNSIEGNVPVRMRGEKSEGYNRRRLRDEILRHFSGLDLLASGQKTLRRYQSSSETE
ncbi:MAG: hypothetical protein LZF60_80351 [Nitrospira sp.]|nr:MAG: hypothetical protein LZF60_80351 [Nitrospira sp.]